MVKKAHLDVRDGQKGSLWHQIWSKRLIMALGMVRKVHYDIRDGQKGSLVLSDGQK